MATVAVLGTGIMGAPMARNIRAAGNDVRAWNRSVEKAQPLAEDGIAVFEDADEAVRGADVVLTMLSDANAVMAVAEWVADDVGDALWLQMSTIGLEGIEVAKAFADKRGIPFVDAPVLGTKQPAIDAKLVVLASGPDAVHVRAQPIFDAVGARTLWLGEAGKGTRLKLVANAWVLTVVEGLAQTVALAEHLDLDPDLFLKAIEGGAMDLPYARVKGRAMIEREFPTSFALALASKDADLVVAAAERHGAELPLHAAIAESMRAGVAAGHGDEDMAATVRTRLPKKS